MAPSGLLLITAIEHNLISSEFTLQIRDALNKNRISKKQNSFMHFIQFVMVVGKKQTICSLIVQGRRFSLNKTM